MRISISPFSFPYATLTPLKGKNTIYPPFAKNPAVATWYNIYNYTKGGFYLTKIRELRKEKRLTISGLSHQLGLNATVLSLTERRKLVPSGRVKKEVCAFFGIPEQQVFDGDGLAV
jgi:DNA-binding XRE family transcriptional regulator